MKALYFEEHGGLEVIQFGDVPDPVPGRDQVLVKVRACAINYLDIWVRRGWPGLKLDKPHWCGADIAGEIAGLGEGVSSWDMGQPVVIDPGVSTLSDEFTSGEDIKGGAAQFIAVPARNLSAMPPQLGYAAAAAPLLVSLTAWRMLIHRAGLRAGESVLIIGAGGGVNTMALQIAKLSGADAYVVASNKEKAQRALELGADLAFTRDEKNWVKEVYRHTGRRGVDVIVDNVGRDTLAQSMKIAAREGRIVMVGNTSGPEACIDTRFVFGKQISLIGSTMGSHQDFLEVTSLLWSGKLKPVIDRVVPLSEGKEAYAVMERGEHFGKIVLEP